MNGPDETPLPEPFGGAETWGKVSQALILLGQVWAATRYRDSPRIGGGGNGTELGPDGDGLEGPDAGAPRSRARRPGGRGPGPTRDGGGPAGPDGAGRVAGSPPPDPAREALRQECERLLHDALDDELWQRSRPTGRRRLLDLAVDLRDAEVTAETLTAAVTDAVTQAERQLNLTDGHGRYVIRDPAAYLAKMLQSTVVDAQATTVLTLAAGENLTTELVRGRGWPKLADDLAQLAATDHAALMAVLADLAAPQSSLLSDLRRRHSGNLAEGLRRQLPTLIANARTTAGEGRSTNPGPGPDPTRADQPTTDRADGAAGAGGGHTGVRTQPADPTTPTLGAGTSPSTPAPPDIPRTVERITKLYTRGQTGDEHDIEAAAALDRADRIRREVEAAGPAAREALAASMAPPTPLWRQPDPVAVLETATQLEGLRARARAALEGGAPTTDTVRLWRQALTLERELIGELGPAGWAALTAELARNPAPTTAASTAQQPGPQGGPDPSILRRVPVALDRIAAAAAAAVAATPNDIDQAMASRAPRADGRITTPEVEAARNYVDGVVRSLVDQLRGDDPTARGAAAAALAALTPDGQLRRAALLQSLPTTVASDAPVPKAIVAAVSQAVTRQWTEPLTQITGSPEDAARFCRELLRSDELPRAVTALADEGVPPTEVIGWFLSPGRQPAHGTLLQQLVTGSHLPGSAAAAWLDGQRLGPIVALTAQRITGEQLVAQLTADPRAFTGLLRTLHELQAETGWTRDRVAATVAEALPAMPAAADPAATLAVTLGQQVERTRAEPVLDQLRRGFASNPAVSDHPGRLDALLTRFSDGVTDPSWTGLVGQITAWSAAGGPSVEDALSGLSPATINRLGDANSPLRYLTGVLRKISTQQLQPAASRPARPARSTRPPAPRTGPPAAAPKPPHRRAPHRGRGGR